MAISIDRSFLEQVDLVSLIEQRTPVRFGKPAGNGSKRTVKGPCPFCQAGTDRFAVFVNDSPQRYLCGIHGHGCGAHGDAIDFLRQYEHLPFAGAVAALGGEGVPQVKYHEQPVPGAADWQSEKWQRRTAQFVKDSEGRLWNSEAREQVLRYLIGRGFTEETIRKAHLGATYNKRTEVLYLVIPWYDSKHDRYWRVTLRDIRPDVDKKHRYQNVTGSSVSEGLYLADSLAFNRPVFLVEGELDALSIAQEAGDRVSVVATGTTSGSQNDRWLMRLANVPHVFVAFDAEQQAEASASQWLTHLSNATRWRTPIGKDANEMLVRGLNIRLWVESALSTLAEPDPEPSAVQNLIPICPDCHTIIGVAYYANVGHYRHDSCGKWLGSGQVRLSCKEAL